ncbi:MAG: Txe/YoeB family addiction module toxin [Gemmatimonadetes bacterium]|nr:Txe/YoeB family addiction module toxin [Gemmatimonadota bacterium]MXY82351.1 Txe/YoeB family addiction module toxin [Gemmatimonadota bacterium]MYA21585.1 Txe/YoeB family addiction module toxin [Gemmatimonadota bacterium]MYB67048.1 Txe/YoeB family addiction module toxin [Gemmatimonadota bacterium]
MNLVFKESALKDLRYWASTNPSTSRKILSLLEDIERNPFSGIGNPKPLRFDYAGCWSRRIDGAHRLVYRVSDGSIEIISCRYHYR